MAVADAVLSFAVESIGKLLIEETNFLRGVREEVGLLHEDLKSMEWFLKYADTKQNVRESVQPWVSEFRAIAYEANDMVEDYALRVSKEAVFTHTLKKCACVFSECHTRHDLGIEIQSLRTRISNLTKRFGEYGIATILMEGQGSISSMLPQLRRTYSFLGEDEFVGLETGVDILVKCLLNKGVGHHKVVSIYGMGGLGKTTLARKVYHDLKLKQYFTGFAWICVSQQWKEKDILQEMLVKLIPVQRSEIMNCTKEEIANRLRRVSQDRRCLIVLDDIWSRDAWDCIKHAVPLTEEGSKILLTTRKQDVALHIDSDGYHYQLPFLNQVESWELLQKKSLLRRKSDQGGEDYHKLEELGKTMVKYCGGLPLAVVVLGGILKTKNSPKEWSIVLENVKSYLEKGENIGQDGEEVSKILAFSYYDLPYQLKPCFLYLRKFREDSEIETERLYQLWLAEGMVLGNDRIGQESMMDVAERYLEELAKRCMVQVEINEEGQPAVTRFKSCRLHDLMRDLCLLKAEQEKLYKVIDLRQENVIVHSTHSSAAIESHYGFVLRLSDEDFHKYIPPQKEQTKHLRSFLSESCDHTSWNDGWRIMSLVNNFKMLRVLAVNKFRMDSRRCFSKSPLKCIGHLIHLRCLRLINCRNIKLPSSLANLKYLETLDLSDSWNVRIPNVLWKMGHLRHLYLPNALMRHGPKLRLDGLISKQLEIFVLLDNAIRHLKHLSKQTNLRAFTARVYGNVEDVEQIINHISNCNYMRIASLEIGACDFRINSDDNNNNKGLAVLEQVLFCKNLHKLEIYEGSCKKLPNHQGLHLLPPSGLTELTLSLCKIEEDPMETLEKLLNLRKLVFYFDSFVGKEMICHAMGFPQLELLQLVCLHNLEKWKVDEGAMPKLCRLEIDLCPHLEMIPDGLKSITTLKELAIRRMPEEFKNRVRTVNGVEGPDYDKIRHVSSIRV